jgi:hypothetical protein
MVHWWSTEKSKQDVFHRKIRLWARARYSFKSLILGVPEVGIEPTRGSPHGILSIAFKNSENVYIIINYSQIKHLDITSVRGHSEKFCVFV